MRRQIALPISAPQARARNRKFKRKPRKDTFSCSWLCVSRKHVEFVEELNVIADGRVACNSPARIFQVGIAKMILCAKHATRVAKVGPVSEVKERGDKRHAVQT